MYIINKIFEFIIIAKLDSNYETYKETLRSITLFIVYLERVLISVKISLQKIVALLSSKDKIINFLKFIQEILVIFKLIKSIRVRVWLLIRIEFDNYATIDLVNI